MNRELVAPYFLALDMDEPSLALEMVRQTANYVGGFKVGPRLILRGGADFVRNIATYAPVFIDMKFYDIPSTMESAVLACAELGAQFVTVHASAGKVALERLAEVERGLRNQGRPFQILAVTILTSFSQESLPNILNSVPIDTQVKSLAEDVLAAGLSGLVCSPHEVQRLRQLSSKSFLLTPGIRLPGDSADDQARTMTPKEALSLGASALVLGRPILKAADPVAKAREVYELLGSLS